MTCASGTSVRAGLLRIATALFSLGFVLLFPQPGQAQNPPLKFFKNYFVTGDYVVRGVSLWRKGVKGNATAVIPALGDPDGAGPLDGVPPTADIEAAFLYVQTAEKIQGSGIHKAKFLGHDLGPFRNPQPNPADPDTVGPGSGTFAKALVNWDVASQPCWSVAYPGGRKLITYRVDVLRFLPIDPVTKKQALTKAHPIVVVVPDAGLVFGDDDEGKTESGTSNAPRALGASLVVVYRDRTKPYSGIVIHDGAYTKRALARMDQPVSGFYQASSLNPSVKMTHVVGDGRPLLSERVYLGPLIATNPFRSTAGPKWDNVTWQWDNPVVTPSPLPGNAAETMVTVDRHGLLSDCLTYSAIVFRTTVQDADEDSLIDVWESSQSPLDDPNVPNDPTTGEGWLPNLHAMGADPNVKDLFVEIGYMKTTGPTTYGNVTPDNPPKLEHSHLPTPAALRMVAQAFAEAPQPINVINVHFDVGDWKTAYRDALDQSQAAELANSPTHIIIPPIHARGGQNISETKLCPSADTDPDKTTECPQDAHGHLMPGQYPRYPGTVGWKTGFEFLKNALLGFERNRKDIFRYVLFGHAVGIPVDPCLQKNPDGSLKTTPAGGFLTDLNCDTPDFHVPRTNSGIADFPGGDLLVTLGGFDNADGLPVGNDNMVVGTIMHEWGHNFLLTHGGVLPQPDPVTFLITRESNCKPNNLSVMNYSFQWGLPDKDGIPRFDYSREEIGAIHESGLIDASLYSGSSELFRYRTKWYAPKSTSYVKNLPGVKAATKHCDGSPLLAAEQTDLENGGGMVRIDAISVLGKIDWNANGSFDGGQQDVNFSGLIDGELKASSKDWPAIRLNELGGRRNVGGYYIDTLGRKAVGPMSLDVGRGDIGRGDIGRGDIGRGDIGRGDIGRGDIGIAIGRGDIGRGDIGRGDIGRGDIGRGDIGRGDIGRGDIGRGGGDLDVGSANEPVGELDLPTARAAEGGAEVGPPSGLVACLSETSELVECATHPGDADDASTPVNLAWQPPNLGAALVADYTVYRFVVPAGEFAAPAPEDLPTVAIDTVSEGTTYFDYDAPAGVQLAYFVRARYVKPIDEMVFDAIDCEAQGGSVISEGTICRFESAISNFATVTTPTPSTGIDSIDLASTILTIEGPPVPYTATLTNGGGETLSLVVLQAYIDQGSASRAPGGVQVLCGSSVGNLPPGTCTFSFNGLVASNEGAGTGTLVPGSATARFELRQASPSTLLDIFTMSVTLVDPGPQTFVVTTLANSGAGSFRQALENANTHTGLDLIEFNIPGAGPHTIGLTSALPFITDPVGIDGLSQPGASRLAPMIVLNGSNPGIGLGASGLTLTGGGIGVRGLVINGFPGPGMTISSSGNTIRANFIGTDPNGTAAVPNAQGIVIASGATNNVIGGSNIDLIQRNIIGGNSEWGIGIQGDNNLVHGNVIGVDDAGVGVPNGSGAFTSAGIMLFGGAANNEIGGSADGPAQNLVKNNNGKGIALSSGGVAGVGPAGSGNAIRSNRINGNTGLGIDVANDGVTANDPQDADGGPNGLQNYPTLTSATTATGITSVFGSLNSVPNATFTLEFFVSASCDASGNGEGGTFLGDDPVTTDASGNAAFGVIADIGVGPGQVITATATGADGTSEFSNCVTVSPSVPQSLFDNGSSSGVQQGTANVATQKLFEDFTLNQDAVVTTINWQQHDHNQATYLSTEVLIFAGLPFSAPPVFSTTVGASRTPNATGTLFGAWNGFDYEISGLSINLPPGTYWLGLNTNYLGIAGSSWDNTNGEPDTIPGYRVVNSNFPAPGLQVGGNLAFTLR